ncbi:hypothetical protein SAMN05661080_03607 [Modestobacter sp. DSM 44400]|uniref:hypothetical protein n=1 Tax=Modestobacter sp. DSM 44400 TaxID=1550230 RepID=UPI000898922D|nr:hypothetical protein [Modestobacter sp. DSM 44400]SDY48028.1 hypothetical protein SAMN05661080_03607 [Modestobacter sp. DSM 44400]
MSEGRPSFWTTVPGVLTGLAALITALVAAGALFLGGDHDATGDAVVGSGAGDVSSAADGDRDPAPTSSGGSSAGLAPASPAGGRVAAGSVVRLLAGDYLDVDTGVQGGNGLTGSDLVWNNVLSLNGVRNAIVPAETDEAGCTAALRTRSDGVLSADRVSRGAVVCLTTDAGALVLASVAPPDVDGSLTLTLTVWR